MVREQLAPVTDSIPQARHLLDGFEGLIHPEKLYQLRLLVSELVTNSVVHAGLNEDHEIGLYASLDETLVAVEVSDGGVGFEKPNFWEVPTPGITGAAGSGFGLYLVESLVERWGAYTGGELTVVWFELAC